VEVRASIGVAPWNGTMAAPATLYAAADTALYRAKSMGGNQVAAGSAAPAA
jgi:GGDEF domain-containing protein